MAVLSLPDLRVQINSIIKANGVRDITGPVMNTQLIDIIDSLEFYASGSGVYVKNSYTYTDFAVAATSSNVKVRDLPQGSRNSEIIVVITESFAGVSNPILDLGITGTLDKYTADFGALDLTNTANVIDLEPNSIESFTSLTEFRARVTGDSNLNNLTAGSFDIYTLFKQVTS